MRNIFVISILLVLAGCSSDPLPIEPPAVLKPVNNEFKITEHWHRDVGTGIEHQYLRFTPVWDEDVLYTVDYQGTLFALDINTGEAIWQRKFKSKITSGVAVTGSTIYLANDDGFIFAIDKVTAKDKWKTRLTSEVLATPLITSDSVITRTVDGNISKLDLDTGKIKWVHTEFVPPLSLRGNSQPAIYGDFILVGTDRGKVYALDYKTGNKVWDKTITSPKGRTEIERLVDIDANLLVVNDLVFVVTYQGRIACLHAVTGQIIWTREFNAYSGMSLDGMKLFISDTDGFIWAIDPRTGATIWKQDKLVRRVLSKPVIQDTYIVVGDFNGFIHWLNREDGKIVARTRLAHEDDQEADQYDDLVFDKKNNFIYPPVVKGNQMIATTRFGYTALYSIK